jgi:hypothetical protein
MSVQKIEQVFLICDRCGHRYETTHDKMVLSEGWMTVSVHSRHEFDMGRGPQIRRDLCEQCFEEFKSFMADGSDDERHHVPI